MKHLFVLLPLCIFFQECSSSPGVLVVTPEGVAEIRQAAQSEADNPADPDFFLEEDRVRYYRNRLLPPGKFLKFGSDCPFSTRVGHAIYDGIFRVEFNCAVNHGWGNVMVAGMLCSPGYYHEGDSRYDLKKAPLPTMYDKEMKFFLTSENVCKQYKVGKWYKGTVYRHSRDSDMITIVDIELAK